MNSALVNVYVIVEGPSERTFFKDILVPYMRKKGIHLTPQVIGKSGKKGGDVKFDRAAKDVRNALKQRRNTYVSTFLDYYGIDSNWPGIKEVKKIIKNGTQLSSVEIGDMLSTYFKNAFQKEYGNYGPRFLPFLVVHEFEALLFSDADSLSVELNKDPNLTQKLKKKEIHQILKAFKNNPEMINNHKQSAPSKRLEKLYPYPKGYNKVVMGTIIGKAIGIEKMREECPHFDDWLATLEKLKILS